MKRRIRVTEGDLHRIVKESVKKMLIENDTLKQIEELERQITEHEYAIDDLKRQISILSSESDYFEDVTPSAPWGRGPEPWHTSKY